MIISNWLTVMWRGLIYEATVSRGLFEHSEAAVGSRGAQPLDPQIEFSPEIRDAVSRHERGERAVQIRQAGRGESGR
jgi:hypothetical protein